VGTTFLAELAAGCLLMTAACRTDHVAASYVRLMMRVAFGLLVVIGFIGYLARPPWWTGADCEIARMVLWLTAVSLLVVPRAWELSGGTARRGQRLILLVFSLCITNFAFCTVRDPQSSTTTQIALVLSLTLGAALLGGTTAAMLLGHAYLTHTSMPIDPLRRLVRLLALAVGLHIVWSAAVLFFARDTVMHPPNDPMWLWLMLAVRLGVGLLGLAVLTYMVYDCVKRRSTQSATGILYIAMIFAFFGELSALELARSNGLWV